MDLILFPIKDGVNISGNVHNNQLFSVVKHQDTDGGQALVYRVWLQMQGIGYVLSSALGFDSKFGNPASLLEANSSMWVLPSICRSFSVHNFPGGVFHI